MTEPLTLAILSDIHYASAAERARGNDYESRGLHNPVLRSILKLHRRYLWMRDPLEKGYLLDRFLEQVGSVDHVIALGDYSCDSAFVGISDSLAFQSAQECMDKLRSRFGNRLTATLGDHELGKLSFMGRQGGMRLDSWRRALELGIQPFWILRLGRYVLVGVASSLVALPLFEPDAQPAEWPEWQRLRAEHLQLVRNAFASISASERILLFCHDPTALPFLWREDPVRQRLAQVEHTLIGHLHSKLILHQSRLLAGIPAFGFLGHTGHRLSSALQQARHWRAFRVMLCPALGGIELLKDGGYWTAELDPKAERPPRFTFYPIRRRPCPGRG